MKEQPLIVTTPNGIRMRVKAEQPLKTHWSIAVTLDGISSHTSPEQPLNALV
jgi:hypothetical protein